MDDDDLRRLAPASFVISHDAQSSTPAHNSNEKMELGSGFLAKLEPFLLMSKSAKGAAAAKLILDATSSPGVFVFGELLDVPSIQEVRTRYQDWRVYLHCTR